MTELNPSSEIAEYFSVYAVEIEAYRNYAVTSAGTDIGFAMLMTDQLLSTDAVDGAMAGFEAEVTATLAAAMYVRLEVSRFYKDNPRPGMFGDKSKRILYRMFESVDRRAHAVAGPMSNEVVTRFLSHLHHFRTTKATPRLTALMQEDSRRLLKDELIEEWESLWDSYDDGDIDGEDMRDLQRDILDRMP